MPKCLFFFTMLFISLNALAGCVNSIEELQPNPENNHNSTTFAIPQAHPDGAALASASSPSQARQRSASNSSIGTNSLNAAPACPEMAGAKATANMNDESTPVDAAQLARLAACLRAHAAMS